MAGSGMNFVQTKHAEYQQLIQGAATAQERDNYAVQALEILGKSSPTQEDTDNLVMLVQRLT
jgi:hypothetical protein